MLLLLTGSLLAIALGFALLVFGATRDGSYNKGTSGLGWMVLGLVVLVPGVVGFLIDFGMRIYG